LQANARSISNAGLRCDKPMHKPVKHTILVADDDRVLAQLLSNRLAKTNYTVVVSYDAMHAFMAAVKLAPSAVILDINMPGGTGLEVLKRLKSSTKTSLIPVIVLSGSIDPADIKSVIDLGADEFLGKPPDFERLEGALTRLLPSIQ
jgi:two-component system, OmpR family, response regulator CpxR